MGNLRAMSPRRAGFSSYTARMHPWGQRILVAFLVIALLAAAALFGLDRFARSQRQDLQALPVCQITVHGRPLTLIVADSPATVGPGLSGQPSLPEDHALLLVSPDGNTRVTLLGMRFPLDVVWLDDGNRVIVVRTALPARLWPQSYSASTRAVAVVELPAGGVERYGIAVGDEIG